MRAVMGLVAVFMVLGAYNLFDEARGARPPDWVVAAVAIPALLSLACVFGYWAIIRTW